MGLCVKFSALAALVELAGVRPLVATGLAVEAVLLHNFAWHVRWTWRDRSCGLGASALLVRLAEYHLGTGAVALVSNIVAVQILTVQMGAHYIAANVAATIFAGLANFLIANFVVFAPASSRT